jgi:hypothetical protein
MRGQDSLGILLAIVYSSSGFAQSCTPNNNSSFSILGIRCRATARSMQVRIRLGS